VRSVNRQKHYVELFIWNLFCIRICAQP